MRWAILGASLLHFILLMLIAVDKRDWRVSRHPKPSAASLLVPFELHPDRQAKHTQAAQQRFETEKGEERGRAKRNRGTR